MRNSFEACTEKFCFTVVMPNARQKKEERRRQARHKRKLKKLKGYKFRDDQYFIIFGYEERERKILEHKVTSHNGRMWRFSSQRVGLTSAPQSIFIVWSCWCDALFPWESEEYRTLSASSKSIRYVTDHWLDQVINDEKWIEPMSHSFYQPPINIYAPSMNHIVVNPFLSYPIRDTCEMIEDKFCNCCSCACHYRDEADEKKVRLQELDLPCSIYNYWHDRIPKWPYIVASLQLPIRDTKDLISLLQSLSEERLSMHCLQNALDQLLSLTDRQAFYRTILPKMKRLVIDLPFVLTHDDLPPPKRLLSVCTDNVRSPLVINHTHLTKRQVSALLCASFFCLFQRKTHTDRSIQNRFPAFDISKLYDGGFEGTCTLKTQKLRAILEYFLRVFSAECDQGLEIVTFSRVSLRLNYFDQKSQRGGLNLPNCPHVARLESLYRISSNKNSVLSDFPLVPVTIEKEKLIEDLYKNHIQIDFANMYAGGAVFGSSCVQEEIRFIISPELLVATLLFERLEDHEAFVVHGTERYSSYCGYGETFRFRGSFTDTTEFEVFSSAKSDDMTCYKRRKSVVVGIDAICYFGVASQFEWSHIRRDIIKACAGFFYPDKTCTSWSIATGNWGCGVFGGKPELKFLIQWVAASLAGKKLTYVLFSRHGINLHELEKLLVQHKSLTCGAIFSFLGRIEAANAQCQYVLLKYANTLVRIYPD